MTDISQTWVENLPSDTSLVVKGPAYFRGIWRSIETALDVSIYFKNIDGGVSNASWGELRPGATKAWYGSASSNGAATATTHSGRPFLDSATSQLFLYTSSTATAQMGSPSVVDGPAPYANAYWLEQYGSFVSDTGGGLGGTEVAFATEYDGIPNVMVFSGDSLAAVSARASDITVGGFTSQHSAPTGDHTYYWNSLGTVSF